MESNTSTHGNGNYTASIAYEFGSQDKNAFILTDSCLYLPQVMFNT